MATDQTTGRGYGLPLCEGGRSAAEADAGHWVRAEADALLNEFPDISPQAHAAELRAKAQVVEGGPEFARAVADEMDRRASAGVRFWGGPRKADDVESI